MGFIVDPEGLRTLGSNLEKTGLDAEGMFSGPHSAVSSISPWGSDEGGAVLSEAHAELAGIAGEVLSLFAETLEAMGHNVRGMGDTVESTDDTGRSGFTTLTGELPGTA
jgi:hypothetical protein